MKRIFVLVLFVLFAFSLFSNTVRIVVLGDNRPQDDTTLVNPRYNDILQKINLLRPDYVINTGDMIMGYTQDSSLLEKEWSAFMDVSSQITVPYFLTVGNHDVSDSLSLRIYKSHFGNDMYYEKVIDKRIHLIFLNSEEFFEEDTFSNEQLQFLDTTLSNIKDGIALIFLHRPIWKYGKWDNDYWKRVIDPILDKHKNVVRCVIAGHQHNYQYEIRNGIEYYITGGGGGPLREEEKFGAFYHFMFITIDDNNNMYVAVIKENGILRKDDIKPGTMDTWYALRYSIKAMPVIGKAPFTFYVYNPLSVSLPVKWVFEKDGVCMSDTFYDTIAMGGKLKIEWKNKIKSYSSKRPYVRIFFDTKYGIMDFTKDVAWSPRLKNGQRIVLSGDRFLIKGNDTGKEGYFTLKQKGDTVLFECIEIDNNGRKKGDWYLTDGLLISLGYEENGKRKYLGTLYLSDMFENNVKMIHFRNHEFANGIKVDFQQHGDRRIYTVKVPVKDFKRLLIDYAMVDTDGNKSLSWWDYTGNTLKYKNSSYMAYYDIR